MASSDATLNIERVLPEDAQGVCHLSIEAGWNQVAADWRLMLGSGVAFGIKEPSGTWVASALTLPLGPSIAWISMVLVTRPERGKGFGTRLLRRCINEVEGTGRAMGLDATEFGRPIYLPLGFRDVYPLSRWSAQRPVRTVVAAPEGVTIRAAGSGDLARIASYDRARSGLDRQSVLDNLLARAPEVAHVAERGNGSLVGYALGRDGHAAMHIGPVVAEDQAIGRALVSQALVRTEGPVILDVPDQQDAVRQFLGAHGFKPARGFMRMVRGAAPEVEDGRRIMALAGPELA
jgi:GNAT superfamily N-acetyltransferase